MKGTGQVGLEVEVEVRVRVKVGRTVSDCAR
jgi:hypothetical protein